LTFFSGKAGSGTSLFVWVRLIVLGLLVGAGGLLRGASSDISVLRKQLAAAQEEKDNPAVIELSRQLVEAVPHDSSAWETLARSQLAEAQEARPELADASYQRCAQTLGDWEKKVVPRPPVIDDLRGDLAALRKDYRAAETYWRSYIAANPKATETLDKLVRRLSSEERWSEALALRTRSLAVTDTVEDRIDRANLYLELHEWDKALTDADKANAMDPADAAAKASRPKFELLKKFLPRIKTLDVQIAKSPRAVTSLLDRAHLLILAGLPNLAVRDSNQAMKLAPTSMRPRIQAAEALLDLGRSDPAKLGQAAKLNVSPDLIRDKSGHVNEALLQTLGARDALVLQNPKKAEPLIARAKTLRSLNQNVLALADAQAALNLDPNSADAHFQVAHALDALDKKTEAISHAEKATTLNPKDPVMWYYRGLLEAQRADFPGAIRSQTESLALRESYVALAEREKCERRTGRVAEANADATHLKQLAPPQE
jgi:tetratricopeptide (TPR) repeat protein